MNRLTLTFDENLRTDRTQIQNIFQYSNTELVILLTAIPPQSPTFNWITPGGVQLDERSLFRNEDLDTGTHYAYVGTIYPGMTEGIAFGSDSGTVRMSLHVGGVLSPLVKIPVDRTILPIQTELIPTNYNELLNEINGAAKLAINNTFTSNNIFEGLTFMTGAVSLQGIVNAYDLNLNGNPIKNVGTPTTDSQAANKLYVDGSFDEGRTAAFSQLTLVNASGDAVATYDGRHIKWNYQGVEAEQFLNLFVEVKTTEANITHGDVLQFTGQVGVSDRLLVKKAVPAEINANPHLIAGVAIKDLPNSGTNTLINWYGTVRNVDTSEIPQGTPIYFDSESTENGQWTTTEPVAPNVQILLGSVGTSANNGTIKIRPNLGLKLEDLHDTHFNGRVWQVDDIIVRDGNDRFIAKTRDEFLVGLPKLNTVNVFTNDQHISGGVSITNTLNVNGNNILNVGTPTLGGHAANKNYVDAAVAGANIPNVTTTTDGLMSSTDKVRLNTLHALLEEDTANSIVDSINEVLTVFDNYPEGADLADALAGKVDKVAGQTLTDNNLTDALKANYDAAFWWGDHSLAGYLTSYTETDPVFSAWDKSTGITINENQILDLGNYIETESDPIFLSSEAYNITTADTTNWNAAYTHSESLHAPTDAEKNTIEKIQINGTDLAVVSEAVDITAVPTTNVEPTADYTGPGHKIAILSAEPATQYNGWIYIITA